MNDLALRAAVLLGVLAVATIVGLGLRRRVGRARDVRDGALLTPADLGTSLGEAATFVQFSSPACSPCRAVHRVLDELTIARPDVAHIHLDAATRLDLARRLGIMRTPTVLVLDARGRVMSRISGLLSTEQALAALPQLSRGSGVSAGGAGQ